MNVVFFNHFHNGDIHVSRTIIRKIMEKVQSLGFRHSFSCAHKNSPDLLADISGLNFRSIAGLVQNEHVGYSRQANSILVNTWYGQQKFAYLNKYGITMDCLYAALDNTCRTLWGFSLEETVSNPRELFPVIDYSKFKTDTATKWLSKTPGKKVFVSNGPALSGQADNFPMSPIVENLAKRYSDVTFILSNKESTIAKQPNVVYSSDIIQKKGFDLNENSFLSTHCDLIVGRASGAFTFAFVQENLFQRYPTFLCFSNLTEPAPNKFWLGDLFKETVQYNAKIILSTENESKRVEQLIDSHLR